MQFRLQGSSIPTPAPIRAGAATFLTGDELTITGAAFFVAPPAPFFAAGATKNTGGFTTPKTWCTHESAVGSLRI